jgi:large subunit ribosomal protein L29
MKASELRLLKDEELEGELHKLKEELFSLRCRDKKTNPLSNPLKLRIIRREIARILTIQHEKKIKR